VHWCCSCGCVETVQGPNEKRLFNDLFGVVRGYNRLERPVVNDSAALVVKFGLVLQQIIGVVSCHSSLRLSLFLSLPLSLVSLFSQLSFYVNTLRPEKVYVFCA